MKSFITALLAALAVGLSTLVPTVALAAPGIDTNPIGDIVVEPSSNEVGEDVEYLVRFEVTELIGEADYSDDGGQNGERPYLTLFSTYNDSDKAGGNLDWQNAEVTSVSTPEAIELTFAATPDIVVVSLVSDDFFPAGIYEMVISGAEHDYINPGYEYHRFGISVAGMIPPNSVCADTWDASEEDYLCSYSEDYLITNTDFGDKVGRVEIDDVKKRSMVVDYQHTNYWSSAKQVKIQLRRQNNAKVKTFTIKSSKLKDGKENKKITKKFLKAGKKYKVRVKLDFPTGHSTGWGKWHKFKMKSA